MLDMRLLGLIVLLVAAVLIGLAAWAWLRGLSANALSLPAPAEPAPIEQDQAAEEAASLRAPTPSGPVAPELVSDTWLNSTPLSAADLRGKVVLIEFWTFG
jgi:hypothetical protein